MVQSFIEGDLGFPAQFALGLGDVGTTHLRIIAGQGAEHNLTLAAYLLVRE